MPVIINSNTLEFFKQNKENFTLEKALGNLKNSFRFKIAVTRKKSPLSLIDDYCWRGKLTVK